MRDPQAWQDPIDARDMTDVRAGVDAVDRELARLIGVRFGFMDAAARIKPARGDVRDEARKAAVIANARANAASHGWSSETAAQLWELLVEASIAHEFDAFDQIAEAGLRTSAAD